MSVDIRNFKALTLRTRSFAPTLYDVVSAEKDLIGKAEFLAKIPTWLSILDHDLKDKEQTTVERSSSAKILTAEVIFPEPQPAKPPSRRSHLEEAT